MEFTDKEKELLKYMYKNLCDVAYLLDTKLNGYGLTTDDIYYLFEKLNLLDIVLAD